MKKVLQLLVWMITILLIIIIVRTLLFKSLQIKSEIVSLPSFSSESIDRLSKAIRFPTVSYSLEAPIDSSSFNGFLRFIDESYPLIRSKLKKEVINKFSLLYTWQGKDPALKPIVLMAHMDVVPPGDTTRWIRGPFSGFNDGTFIWGRGTLDDKGEMISILEVVEKMLSEGYEPERTIYLSFGHDEEIGGLRGAKINASELKTRGVDAEFVLDEGMPVTLGIVPMIKHPVALIGTSEKGYLSVKLTAEMAGGHSSTPERESALIVINRAVYRLVNNQMKPSLSGPVKDFIRYIGPEMPFYAKAIFANKWLFKSILLSIYQGSGSGNALVRTTTAPTMMQAGIKDNIIPAKAEAVINFRILPGQNSSDVIHHIEKVVADKRVKISPFEEEKSEPVSVSPVDVPAFSNILLSLRQAYPQASIAPTIMLASSDSKHYTGISRNIYRFSPIIITSEDMTRIHGLNERTSIEDFKKGMGFYYQVIKNSQGK